MLLDEALSLLKKGISVIPVGKNKIPLISWKEFQSRLATEDEVRKWFSPESDAQLGIVTGKISNLTVVDVENDGDPCFLPQNTTIIKTGGGGWHYYYLFCDGINNKARIKDFVDIRSEGGYVVAPGSKSDKGEYSVIKTCPLAPFPSHLFQQKDDKEIQKSSESLGVIEINDYPGYGTGQRNDQMTRYVGYVLSKTHPAKWETEAWGRIVSANEKNNPPLPEKELKTIYESIKSKEVQNNPDKWNTPVDNSPLEKVNDEDDSLGLMSIVAKEQSSRLNTSTPTSTGFPSLDKCLDGGFRIGDLIILSGETGNGKTTVASTIAIKMAKNNIPVLFLTYEVFVSEVWEKIKMSGVPDTIPIYTPRCHTSGTTSWVRKKIKEAKEKGVRFVVIDHLEFLTGDNKFGKNVNMNYSNKVSEVVKEVKNLARNEGVCIILLCHLRKVNQGRPSVDDLKDTASISQESDAILFIERIKNPNPTDEEELYLQNSVLSLQKNRRNGKTKYIKVRFDKGIFSELTNSYPQTSSPEAAKHDTTDQDKIIKEMLAFKE